MKLEKKISTDLEFLEFYKILNVGFTKFKTNQILPNKISYLYQITTKLFTGLNIPITCKHGGSFIMLLHIKHFELWPMLKNFLRP